MEAKLAEIQLQVRAMEHPKFCAFGALLFDVVGPAGVRG